MLFRSYVAIPLKTSQKKIGVMVLVNAFRSQASAAAAEPFAEENLQTLLLIASRMASSIENLHLDVEIKNRLADLSALQEISETFYAHPIFEFDLAKMVRIILKAIACDFCSFMFFNESSASLSTELSSL